jgi:5-methylcytosine-specific restriction endonuclease McrA
MPEPRVTEELRRLVAIRAQDCCEYCRSQARYATQRFSAEHIVSRARGGRTTPENLAHACQGCNNRESRKQKAES